MKQPIFVSAIVFIFCVLTCGTEVQADTCFRGRPLPECSAFWLTETGIGYMGSGGGRFWPIGETGMMFNISEDYAVGATGYLAYDGKYEDLRGGIKVRLRRWLRSDISLNVSGGLLLAGGDYNERHPGFTGHVDVNFKDIAALYLGSDIMRGGSLDGANWHAGIRCGTHPGLAGLAVGAALGLLYFINQVTAP